MADPYASHVKALKAVLNSERPKRVLEYGGGAYSTSLFLRREEVELVVTVETDDEWRGFLIDLYPERHHRVLTDGNPSNADFDLIFIDDGTEADHRIKTIRKVLSKPHPVVVIHDADVPEYAQVISELADRYWVLPTDPDTAVIPATNE